MWEVLTHIAHQVMIVMLPSTYVDCMGLPTGLAELETKVDILSCIQGLLH